MTARNAAVAAGLLCLQFIATACGTAEVLPPLPGGVPNGVDLSGTWTLRSEDSDGSESINRAIGATDSRPNRVLAPVGQPQPVRSRRGGLVHVFLETGTVLKITQTPYAVFISFDRAIVEEYRFGENRQVSVGEIEAQRVSGWVDRSYVVETLDKNGMKLTDTYWLSEDQTVLHREITFRSRKNIQSTVHQMFDKSSDATSQG